MVSNRGRFIAGGIDLLGEMKDGLAAPGLLVNVKQIPGTWTISNDGANWTIGANVTLVALASHAGLRAALPGLCEAADEVGSPQMRNVATVGGNLAQHSRCWYFRHRDVACLKKGGRRCFARGGNTKYHSLFTGCMCLSPCTSNLAVMLTALGARVVIQRGDKVETIPIAALYESAWSNARSHNSLGPADLILRVEVAAMPGLRSTYLQMSEKSAFDWALVSCAASGRVQEGKLRGVRVALGSVAPVPWMVDEANASLEGVEPTGESVARAADLILQKAHPQLNNGYKVPLARALVSRTLLRLAS